MTTTTTPRRWSSLLLAGALAVGLSGAGLGLAQAGTRPLNPNSDAPAASTAVDTSRVIVQLTRAPLSTSSKVNRGADKKVSLSGSKTKAERALLAKDRNALAAWLKANTPKATITGQYDIALNAVAVKLNGTSIDTLRAAPGVTSVGYQQTYRPLAHEDPDLALIDAPQGWAEAGATSAESDPSTWAGFGVKVAIVDTGIDVNHPCFDDTGFPQTAQRGPGSLTNNKVIVARVFNEKAKKLGDTPKDLNGHGTHVAGTVACNLHTPAVVEGVHVPYDPSGVAPGAQLGNYAVFPGPDSDGRSEDILNALDAAASDDMDVINMSLGGGYHGNQDLLTLAVDNLDRNGIVVAVAAGNDGPGYQTTGSPGSAERALTAGASSVGHYVGVPVYAAGGAQVTVAAIGDFPVPETDLTAQLALTTADGTLGDGCTPTSQDLTGQIALISRGACTFGTKVSTAEDAGAVAVIIVNNQAGPPIAMATDAAFPTTIPAVMAPRDDSAALLALVGTQVTIGSDKAYTHRAAWDNILADFSSWGPVRVSYRVKPDVVAPGANVLSSQPLEFCAGEKWADQEGCWAFYSGTSMATPHLAGMSAVVIGAHPDWPAWTVRSAVANTADIDGVVKTDLSGQETDVQKVGNGLADLDAAVTAEVAFNRTTLTFGAVTSGSGKGATTTVQVTNLTDSTRTFAVSKSGSTVFSVSPSSVTLGAGQSATLTVSLATAKKQDAGQYQGHLFVGDSHMALYAYVK